MRHAGLLSVLLLSATAAFAADETPVFQAAIERLVVKQQPNQTPDEWRLHAFLSRGGYTFIASGQVDRNGAGTLALYDPGRGLGEGMDRWGHMNVLVEGCTLYANVYRTPAAERSGSAIKGQLSRTGAKSPDTARADSGKSSTAGADVPPVACGVTTNGSADSTLTGQDTSDCMRTLLGSREIGTNGEQGGTGKTKSSTSGSATFVGATAFENAICIGTGEQ